MGGAAPGFAELWDWRRAVSELYAAVRAEPDPRRGWDRWRRGRDDLFASHPQTPIEPDRRARFDGLRCFPYDPALRFEAAVIPVAGASPERFEAGEDGTVTMFPFARTDGLRDRLGGELVLYWITGYGGGVFLPFRDATSGRGGEGGTYGGGRYLLDTIKGADLGRARDGGAVLDFNFAYAPSCAYADRYVCPLAPPGNRLPGAVAAGEIGPRYRKGSG